VLNLKVWPIRNAYQFNKIPIEIYTNVFFDAGYVYDKSGVYKQYGNTMVNKIMYGIGIGIDFVTYYDKTLRLDYSFNALGENGLFIHWKAAIR
jgi:outer membrane protein assembly factor BamA